LFDIRLEVFGDIRKDSVKSANPNRPMAGND
jgi:hypothetical protein